MPDDTTAPQQQPPPGVDINQLLASLLGNAPVAPPPQVQNVNLAATRPTSLGGILGEALAGGPPSDVPLTAQQRDAAGRRALLSASIGMMNVGPFASIGQGIGAGLSGAMASQAYSEAVEAERQTAAQDWQNKQQALQLERLKEALPLLTLERLQGIPSSLAGGGPSGPGGAVAPTASVGATSNAADFTSKFTPIAQTIANKTGLPLSYVLSQAGLETGWGSSPAARNNNFFGMTDPATGKLMSFATPEAGAQAYIDLMASDRYKNVPRAGTPQQIGDAMALAGYNPNVPTKGSTDSYGARIGAFAGALAPGAPRPYQVASAGPVPPPPSAPSTTLPVPPVPPKEGIPIPGGQGLVLKPDGTIGTPGGGFKGPPVATAAPPPATTTPTGPPAPQATTQQPPQPPTAGAVVAPPQPSGSPPGRPTFTFDPNKITPPPDVAAGFSTKLSPDEEAEFQNRFVDAQRRYQIAQATGDSKGMQDAQADISTTRQALIDARKDRLQTGTNNQIAWNKQNYDQQKGEFDANLGAWNKSVENEQTARLGVQNKVLETMDGEAGKARDTVDQLDILQALSNAAGSANPIGAMEVGGRKVVDWLTSLGVGTPGQQTQWTAQQALDAAVRKLSMDMRSGQGMGRLTNQELSYMMNILPNMAQTPQTRNAIVAYMRSVYQRKLDYVNGVHQQMATPGMTLTQAMDNTDKSLGPIVPQMPTNLQGDDARRGWILQNVTPGTFYKMDDGTLRVRGQ